MIGLIVSFLLGVGTGFIALCIIAVILNAMGPD